MLLSEARSRYAKRAGNSQSFIERLNSIQERLLPYCNSKNTKVAVRHVVYKDAAGNSIVTLPRELGTILAGAYQAKDPDAVIEGLFYCGKPLPIRNEWYESSPSGPDHLIGTDWSRGIVRLSGHFTTFADWAEPMKLRIKLEVDESPGGEFLFRGRLAGARIFSIEGDRQIEGVKLSFTNATVTTTHTFDEPPYQIVKPLTRGRVKLYSVDEDDNEKIVAWYDPDETNPSYVRYKVPACPTDPDALT